MPSFEIVPRDGSNRYNGWVIKAIWHDGREEQLVGVFTSQRAARGWLTTGAARWLQSLNTITIQAIAS